MKKLFAPLALALLLAACGGSSASTCTQSYWDGTIGTCLPDGWHIAEDAELEERGIPQEVFVAFQSDEPFSGQYPTVTVTRESIDKDVTSEDYSEANMEAVKSLPGYEEIDSKQVTIDGSKVHVHVFGAQPRPEDPKTRFYQVSIAADGNGYSFTGAVPLGVEDTVENQILLILQNATLKEATKE